mgnify:CR=1 FL=1|jgi:putative peptidoglycan lipid II flippase
MILFKNFFTVGYLTFTSRVFGFVRDILIASILGASFIADAFFVAFKLPNLFRRLFAEGAFNAAFIPVLSGEIKRAGKKAAIKFSSGVASVLFWFLLILVVVFEIFMPIFMHFLAPGFSENPEKFDLAVEFTRITFPYLLFISLVSLQSGLLNIFNHFAAAAATPILLNLSLIFFITVLLDHFPNAGYALAWGVSVAGIIQFFWMYSALNVQKLSITLLSPKFTAAISKLLKLFMPAALGAGVYQVNLLVDLILASTLSTGSISYLYFADRISQLPIGVVGVALGTALLPILSKHLKRNENSQAFRSQNQAIEISLLFSFPASIALIILAEFIVTVLFQRGVFTAFETQQTANALIAFSLGLPAYILIKVLAPGFFAREDTKTPVQIAIVCMILNLILNLILMIPLAHVGLALATAISSWVNAIALFYLLKIRGYLKIDKLVKSRIIKIFSSTLILGMFLIASVYYLENFLVFALSLQILLMSLIIFCSLFIYFLTIHLLGAAKINIIWKSRGKKLA